MHYWPQILPHFSEIRIIQYNFRQSSYYYHAIYCAEQNKHNCIYLLDEQYLLSDFIKYLGELDHNNTDHDRALDFYHLHVAYNIKFSLLYKVMLIDHQGGICYNLKDFADILYGIKNFRQSALEHHKLLQYAIFLKRNHLPDEELYHIKRDILQQFIYLRMYLPVIIADDFQEAQEIFTDILFETNDNLVNKTKNKSLSVLGTKKSGKSALISALLGKEYTPIHSELPTPNQIRYSWNPIASDAPIKLYYQDQMSSFSDHYELCKYIEQLFLTANQQQIALHTMQIYLQQFPDQLKSIDLVDTPGPNFASCKAHQEIAMQAIQESNYFIYLINYSNHLTDDEMKLFDCVYRKLNQNNNSQPILIAINHIDAIYHSDVIKSYERVTDYIKYRLNQLGYTNILVMSISAILDVYIEKLRDLLIQEYGNFEQKLQNIKKKYHTTQHRTFIAFIESIIANMQDFHDIEIQSVSDLKNISRIPYLMHLIYYLYILEKA